MTTSIDDEAACARLLVRTGHYADAFRDEDFVALFAPDGSVERMGEVAVGHGAIRAFLSGRKRERRARHVLSPPLIDIEGPDTARGVARFVLYDGTERGDDGELPVTLPASVGEFHQTYRRIDGAWKVATHRSVAAFRRA